MNAQQDYYMGFDVGTGSARACLVDRKGKLLAEHSVPTKTHRSPSDHRIFEQSTTDIWTALSTCSRTCLSASGIPPSAVKGIGFDATCSLAVVDRQGQPVSISRMGADRKESDANLGSRTEVDGVMWDIILWADHRAEEEAALINSTGEGVLGFVGETMSLEMEVPKTLWLSKHMAPERFKECMLFDLTDYLTYRCTTSLARSTCSLACKFSYVPPGVELHHKSDGTSEVSKTGWQGRFFEKIGAFRSSMGLGDMVKDDFEQLGGIPGKNGLVLTAGQPVGQGLSEAAAKDLGLQVGTPVGSGVIDAYAGWIGTVAASQGNAAQEGKPRLRDAKNKLAAIAGTSTCHLAQSEEGILVPGVWGPYRDAVFPGLWMNEGGQSSTGQLIDFMITTHAAYPRLRAMAADTGKNIFEILAETLEELRKEKGVPTTSHLTKDMHFYPDLHGNRSPLADMRMKGMLMGLTLDDSIHDLARKFNLTLEAIALQTRHIVDEMNANGHVIDSIYMSGSQAKNAALMGLLATVLQMPIIIPPQPSAAVVLGSAMLGRFAADMAATLDGPITTQEQVKAVGESDGEKLWDVMVEMTQPATSVLPRAGEEGKVERRLLDQKYKIFREAVEVQKRWRGLMDLVK